MCLFTGDHAFTYPHGGYLTLYHNKINSTDVRDLSYVAIEPTLQPVSNEHFFIALQVLRGGAHLVIRA